MRRRKAKQAEEHWALQRELAEAVPEGTRLHMSPKKIPRLHEMTNPVEVAEKPETGFWWDLDGDWAAWCAGNHFCFGRYYYIVDLDYSDILRITDTKEFLQFEEKFQCKPWHIQLLDHMANSLRDRTALDPVEQRFAEAWRTLSDQEGGLFFGKNAYHINWPEVAKQYKGIEIVHLGERRMRAKWYNVWDCASGVAWDVSAIKRISPYARWDGRRGRFIKEES